MVSRSLEKMMLIAIGLSTAVIVGVPVLMYAIDTITVTSYLENAQMAAEQIHNTTRQVDLGTITNATIQVHIPEGVTVSAVGFSLQILFDYQNAETQIWMEMYDHPILITPITEAGSYLLYFYIQAGTLHITYS
ncbi:MAG: hypothetical protein ACFFDM_10355 [Candidatus Thorarchaeota archaeon]